jgi:hypothetical protein
MSSIRKGRVANQYPKYQTNNPDDKRLGLFLDKSY